MFLKTPNLTLFQQSVDDPIVEQDQVVGVVTQMGLKFRANAVVLAVGTFLGGKIHIGMEKVHRVDVRVIHHRSRLLTVFVIFHFVLIA